MSEAEQPNEETPVEAPEQKYKPDDYTLEQLDEMVDAEEKKWKGLGIGLDNMNFGGAELFYLQCKVQALTNCILEQRFDHDFLNRNLKAIIVESMETIRENIEPQINQMRILAGVHAQGLPDDMKKIAMPWENPGGNRGN